MHFRVTINVFFYISEYLVSHQLDHRSLYVRPRGLINSGNCCYINSVLQALVACGPLLNLLTGIGEYLETIKSGTVPFLENM